ncbi:MAG: aminodeoxychorismate/anthranilate synthase component II [Legionellaceae bacterium]|nr:aminodeoxychorismate/anthranilate synthase component II [Legionellaceae bacterium]HAF87040.1 aminodeoxychorismate/anthranilate synthase component II [Legionellales bacterium]HCA89106.1 aminodeoxychorismate/anthranilate synthase component II [Legionellales bacterium]|tara:strand:+ start:733 stop:1314 length:582 start_codon:yes stop_codon:yes gene_type:complete
MLLLIDNFDSFTYNLVQYFLILDMPVVVRRCDAITLSDITNLAPRYIVLSPGPHSPKEAKLCVEVIRTFYQSIPILGVCLGHQCLGYAFGAQIITAPVIMHGKTSKIFHHQHRLFDQLPQAFNVMRYHSLMIDLKTLPSDFAIDAFADDGTIMAISHRQYPVFGLQFHPESIASEHGLTLLKHFLNYETIRYF